MDQGEFMMAQVEWFIDHGIDPDAISREELAETSITFRATYETETSKDSDTAEPDPG